MTHYIKDKYVSRWFREGQGKGPSAENKEEEKAKKKIPKKRAFTYSCIYTAGTQTHDRTYDRTQYLADKIQNCSKGCLKLEVDRSVCRALFTSKRGALSSLVTRQLQTPTRRIKGDSRYHRANRSPRGFRKTYRSYWARNEIEIYENCRLANCLLNSFCILLFQIPTYGARFVLLSGIFICGGSLILFGSVVALNNI